MKVPRVHALILMLLLLLSKQLSASIGDSLSTSFLKSSGTYESPLKEGQSLQKIADSLRKAGNSRERFVFLNSLSRTYGERKKYFLQAFSLNLLGSMYNAAGKYQDAVNTFKAAELLYRKDKESDPDDVHAGISNVYMNTGNSFFYLDDSDRSLYYYRKSLTELKKKKNFVKKDQERLALIFNNLGIGYSKKNDAETGRYYFRQALLIDAQLGDSMRIANVTCNLAAIEAKAGRSDSALKLLFSVKDFYERQGDPEDKAYLYREIAEKYYQKKDISLAKEYAFKAIANTDTNEYSNLLVQSYDILYHAYQKAGDTRNELKYYTKYNTVRDSARQDEVLHSLQNKEMQLEFEKVRLTDSLTAANTIRNRDLKIEQEKRQNYYLIGFLLLAVIGLGIIYNRFKVTNRQKKIIEEQKKEVDIKNREIIESISYAKRLQEAILPSETALRSVLKEHFVIYRPKDIVAGDFYWLHTIGAQQKPEIVLLAAADCTGHGVPGAMMSVACNNALNRTIDEFKVGSTGEVLDAVKKLIVENFNRNESTIRDGMDISLLAISRRTNTVEWSGANNRLLYLHEGALIELKADKQPVGYSEKNEKFSTHSLPLHAGDVFYLLTDGFVDQFGGDKNKKMGIKYLRELLELNKNKSLEEQRDVLEKAFVDWKGSNEQIDDVTLIGVRI